MTPLGAGASPSVDPRPVVLFDGVCGLCTRSVRFIIRRDPEARFIFCSLQSEEGRGLAGDAGLDAGAMDTLILLEGGEAFVRSDAALRIARRLSFPWRLAGVLLLVPRVVREPVYRLVARHRYRVFGRLDNEWTPERTYASRFIGTADGAGEAPASQSQERP